MRTLTKDDIRRAVRARKALLDERERSDAADRAFAMLEQTAEFLMADRILMYHSLADELPTRAFIDRWDGRKSSFFRESMA